MGDKIILIIKYIIISIIQGIGEILPISSSGHMIIIQTILGLNENDLIFEIFLHFASLLAIILFFFKKLWTMAISFFTYILNKDKRENEEIKRNFKLTINLIIATIPAGIIGILFNDLIGEYLSSMWTVGIFLLLTSAMLFISTKINRTKTSDELTYFDALFIGLFQCIGILPGISRSGSCLTGGSLRKINQSDAAEFAFIMAIPIMLGSALVSLDEIGVALQNKDLFIPYIIAFIVTFITTYFALKVFLKIIRKQKLTTFSIYCLIMGIVSIVLGLTLYK